jgi:hypothetical protein
MLGTEVRQPPTLASAAGAWRPLGVAGAAVAGLTYLALVDPNEPGHYPTCPFRATTGLYCPGCGSLRALHFLARGDIPAAVGKNVLTVIAAVGLLVGWILWLRRSVRRRPRTWVAPAWPLYTAAAAVVVFAVARNLPGGQLLAP